tara:strand:+ start:40063 stop:40659 length:597 start_codon:yes stop_codon:yes gene_type:complete
MIDHNPLQEFHKLFCKANDHSNGSEVNAMLLTTIGQDGFPHSRTVLLKKYDWDGLTFFTNYDSKKGRDIAYNNRVHLLFQWQHISTEIHIEGIAEKLPEAISQNYFSVRPRESKLGAYASQQSRTIASRKLLDAAFAKADKAFQNKEVPKPNNWGGYLVKPSKISFINNSNYVVEDKTYALNKNYNWSLKAHYFIKEK